MVINKKIWINGILLLLVAGIHLFSRNPARVESAYSNTLYPWIGRILRVLWGWSPVSIGDVVYGLLVVWLIYRIVYFRKTIRCWRSAGIPLWKGIAGKVFRGMAVIYILFNLLWGLNYNRLGLKHQVGISRAEYTEKDLLVVNELLLQEVNRCKAALDSPYTYPRRSELFKRAVAVYDAAAAEHPFLSYRHISLKPSLWGWIGNYSGFTGYYNPFTGEGQTNTLVPPFLQPFIACHEMAHQIGYAREDEANFAAFLAVHHSSDMLFRYSGYLDLFLYANRNLFEVNEDSALMFRKRLIPAVQADLMEWKRFAEAHRNPVAPWISWLYGKYLEQNQQPSGMRSYDQVTAYLISYYKKYGKL
ncbi:MAG TPA: DUF3810 domain-containing protein [Ferruginibacter sp.]|nr:DUF3810 domain-containing protein [Ferruginibacter sp.]HRO97313.1 DUF3810 domain-containing protein [Ferruginibacter sp.]HRP50464.1 DUF3810 domain-containing protein [Ferruginibacter sp.]